MRVAVGPPAIGLVTADGLTAGVIAKIRRRMELKLESEAEHLARLNRLERKRLVRALDRQMPEVFRYFEEL